MASLIRITDLSLAQPTSLHGYHLDSPQAGKVVETRGTIEITGWALGKYAAAIGVEVSSGGEVRRRSLINGHRPDVADAFPDVAGAANSGFGIHVPVDGTAMELDLEISVILADHRIVPLATVRGERTWRGADRPVTDSLVSVVIACDGRPDFLRDAIESVMAQTHPHLEVVVVVDDDCSDNPAEVAGAYPGVRCVRQEQPGFAEARNTGIRHTIGDFLVFIGAADRLLPEAIEIGLGAFAANPAAGFVFGGSAWITRDGSQLELSAPPSHSRENGYLDLLEHRSLRLGAVLFRRASFEGGRRFDPALSAAADWDLLLTGMREFPVFGHGHPVTEHRWRDSDAKDVAARVVDAELAVLRRHRKTALTLPGGREAHRAGVRRCKDRRRPGPGPAPREPAESKAPPRLTVALITDNHARFIAEAIEGVLAQRTTCPYELIIADDCSTDGTREIVASYQQKDPDLIRLILPESKLGEEAIWRSVIEAATGEYMAFLSGDDCWTSPAKLQAQIQLLDEHPEHVVVFHDVSIDPGRHRTGTRAGEGELPAGRRSFDIADLLNHNVIPSGCAVVRRAAIDPLPSWIGWPTDWMTWVAAAQSGSIAYLDEKMSVCRVHAGSTWSGMDRTEQLLAEIAVQQRFALVLRPPFAAGCAAEVLRREVQLSVERARLPYRHATAVLGAPPAARWYFNGREVRTLQGRGLVIVEELERLRREPATGAFPDNMPAEPPREGPFIPVVIPADAGPKVEDWDYLHEYLGAHQLVWVDDHCTIFELPAAQPGPERTVKSVQLHEPFPESLLGGHLDGPSAADSTGSGSIDIAGWVLGKANAHAVQVSIDGNVVRAVPVGWHRPDVGEAFPDVPGAAASGFQMSLDLSAVPVDTDVELTVSALLANGETAPLAAVVINAVR